MAQIVEILNSGKPMIYIVETMAADDLATQRSQTSVAILYN